MSSVYSEHIKQWAGQLSDQLVEPAAASSTVDNPLCGDRATVSLTVVGRHIDQVGVAVKGCLLCRAAGAMVEQAAAGCDAEEIENVAEQLGAMLRGELAAPVWPEAWQPLGLFSPLQDYKSRHSCVMICLRSLQQALQRATDND
jgi:nitrogen fixation NifU-like protein